jgi:DNA-binding IclR family transcriptional regulator
MAGRPPRTTPLSSQVELKVEAVERALAVLDVFLEGEAQLTLSEVARRSGLYPSTVLRLSASLERFGYIRRDQQGAFQLASKPLRLGQAYQESYDPSAMIRPILRDLATRTGETAAFYVREGDDRVCLMRANGSQPLRSHLVEGSRSGLEKGASAHVLRAFSEQNEARHEPVRRDGYAVSRGERAADTAGLAVPVLAPDARLFGALGLTGPITRFTDTAISAWLPALQSARESLEASLAGE